MLIFVWIFLSIKENLMTEVDRIQKVVHIYIDSMENSDPEKVRQAFHANAKVVGYLHGDFVELSTEDFAGFVASQQPSPKEKNENIIFDILSCDIEGTIASVKIRDQYLGITFLDILSLIKHENEWKIYNKLFHVESE
tara:strand:+ start:824 stop:1237 length:414 start_codon:yes stop_codon:yes gene_type:complete